MRPRLFTTASAILLIVALVAPSVFLVAPQSVYAVGVLGVPTSEVPISKITVESTISAIKNTLIEISTFTSKVANVAMQVDAYVLQPLAFVLSGNLMKALTASVISFVIGKANGTGVPQFVVDVQRSMQTVGDSQALAFFTQFNKNSNSPFAGAIVSSLRNNYLSGTSLAGFWAANMCTLAKSSPNVSGFLAGNWSQGGVAAWFALTTQDQNNPYTLYQKSQAQLSSLIGPGVGGATGSRLSQLSWGQGFMSWCGGDAAKNAGSLPPGTAGSTQEGPPDPNALPPGTPGSTQEGPPAPGTSSTQVGINPGDPCTKSDGTAGTIKTPGSTIKATLDKVLGGQQDQIVRMGNVGPQINQILGNIATVLQTVQFASQILGGPGSGGLFGVDTPSGTNSTSRLIDYQNSSGNLGVTNSAIYQSASTLPSSGSDMLNQITQYQSAWNAIGASANNASTNVTALVNYCNAQTGQSYASPTTITTQVRAAQTALATEIAPVLAQAAAASTTAATAAAMVQKIQSELNSGTETAGNAYAADLQKLQTMPPTMQDVANALQDAQSFGGATASPAGSLTVSGSSLVDQMTLISTNAVALKSACTPVAPARTIPVTPTDSSTVGGNPP